MSRPYTFLTKKELLFFKYHLPSNMDFADKYRLYVTDNGPVEECEYLQKELEFSKYSWKVATQPPLKKYKYFITFTAKQGVSREKLVEVQELIAKRQEKLSIIFQEYTIEHEDSNVHVHMYLETKKPCPKNRFKHYERNGLIDYKTVKDRDEGDIRSYIRKEADPKILVDRAYSTLE